MKANKWAASAPRSILPPAHASCHAKLNLQPYKTDRLGHILAVSLFIHLPASQPSCQARMALT